MKAPAKQTQFRIPTETGSDYVDNFYIIYSGEIPGCIERGHLVPDDIEDASDWSEQFDMVPGKPDDFQFDVGPLPFPDEHGVTDTRTGCTFGTDHKGNVQYFHLPEGSIFKAMTIRELCEHHGWKYDDLKEATQEIRFCYDL